MCVKEKEVCVRTTGLGPGGVRGGEKRIEGRDGGMTVYFIQCRKGWKDDRDV